MSSSANAPAVSRLSHLRHEARELEDLFDPLSRRKLRELTPQGGPLHPPVGRPVPDSLRSLHHVEKYRTAGKVSPRRRGTGTFYKGWLGRDIAA